MKKLFLVFLLLTVIGTVWAEGGKETGSAGVSSLPRKETLYVGGLQWGPPQNFNPLSTQASFPLNNGWRMPLLYETLFLYNQLDNSLEPHIGLSYEWVDDLTLRIQLRKGIHFNDGSPLTAEDVAYSYLLGEKYPVPWSATMTHIKEVVAADDYTVLIRMKPENPNRLYVLDSLGNVYVLPSDVWSEIEKKYDYDGTKIIQEFNAHPIASGPYKIAFYDDTRIVLERDDNYWGKAVFGKLPAPKYIAHLIYKSNEASSNAFRQGQIDVNQQFIPKVWTLWEKGAPFKTYLRKPPYYIPGSIPSLFFNMTKKGLDVPEVRRALAMCIDYAKVVDVAMSGYSTIVRPGLMLPVYHEQELIDTRTLESVSYSFDVDAANALLDSIGAKPGPDGIRVLPDGTRLGPWEASCPYGWSDWNATLEIVAQSARKIGIEIRTKFPEFPVWLNDVQNGYFDIAMWLSTNPGMAQPWDRFRAFLDSRNLPPIGKPVTANYNYGRYKNERVNELLSLIPPVTDENTLRELYTELNLIFIRDLPQIPLMYRPSAFYTVYEGVWTGFPDEQNNPYNIPPTPISGAFVKALYYIQAK
ncbi:ABC-type transporter, periplasmic subunit [Spirochaeta thermophila DSM 6578]|uniref:ABC-type transporter, periplasmic subunit n=1 Tax=Winmispira thermophila (strain ATCC 700085 / DSM 6578 / Z-1203) TaxID=869211 RepID=G0GB12_WINT7|nr:ABC transporter substrate-binding protein [Spirochaeta thermophila]AEJ61036.1 ABC-type transporter, periplasmic subunit [Spirochaeta thermophila DSM 6578]